MPRMPKPGYPGNATNNTQNTMFRPKPSLGCSSGDNNIKIVLLEDKLREDLAPKNLLLLDETFKIPQDSYIYIFDNQSTSNKLKRISSKNVKSTILDQVSQKIDLENILSYSFVDSLPDKENAKSNTIYIVPSKDYSKTHDFYNEYLFIKEKNEYEKLGYSDIDLSEYRTAEEQDLINKALEDLILTKLQNHTDDINNPHKVTANQVGLGNVDNTSDLDKPISTDTQNALDQKVDKIVGKQLSTEDFTTAEKLKLENIENNANNYSLPIATDSILGGVKIGENISISDDGTISTHAPFDPSNINSQIENIFSQVNSNKAKIEFLDTTKQDNVKGSENIIIADDGKTIEWKAPINGVYYEEIIK